MGRGDVAMSHPVVGTFCWVWKRRKMVVAGSGSHRWLGPPLMEEEEEES